MNFTAFLVLLALMKIMCSSSLPACGKGCKLTDVYHHLNFKHVSDLQFSSVAPWNLIPDCVEDRDPPTIENAVCGNCIVENMIAKPIYLKIYTYSKVRNGTGHAWCRCPYEMAVGCTCVREQKI